jgi:Peptidase inhibitor family I36
MRSLVRESKFGVGAHRLGVSLLLSGVATLLISVPPASFGTTPALAASCADGHICFFTGTNFNGSEVSRGDNYCAPDWDLDLSGLVFCQISHSDPGPYHSAKNRFGDRHVLVLSQTSGFERCVPPGGNPDDWPSPDNGYYFHIGAEGEC